MNTKVDNFIANAARWQKEFEALRALVLDCQLDEELKWGTPCYSYQGKNIALIHGFKEYCAILFVKGSLLSDSKGILIQQTENVQAHRQIRFTKLSDVTDISAVIKTYIFEAIEIEKAGLKVELKKVDEYKLPEELVSKFNDSPEFKAAFEALTPGRQRAYILHFSQPKQAKTRDARIEKNTTNILIGKGLNE